MSNVYTHGHHDSVLSSHRWRTAENSAHYLLPHLRAGLDLLDVGCGPGTITADFADVVAPGAVVGLDAESAVLEEAQRVADGRKQNNVSFVTGNVYDLQWENASFDVVHAHQVLQHLSDPVAALQEMGRVVRPGGVLAIRDCDFGTFIWAPDNPVLDRWLEIYYLVARHNGAEPNAGRHYLEWLHAAGFSDITLTTSTWTYADEESRRWWGELWSRRVVASSFAEQAVTYGYATNEELAAISNAWSACGESNDGLFAFLHSEAIVRL